MSDTKQYIEALFKQHNLTVAKNKVSLFAEFIKEEINIDAVTLIKQNQQMMMDQWKIKNKIQDIMDVRLQIPNGTMGKLYDAKLDIHSLGKDIRNIGFEDLLAYGLEYDSKTSILSGTPTQSGDFKIKMTFSIFEDAGDSSLYEKQLSLIINADPKSLWKDIPSTKTDHNYWKPDNVCDFQTLGDKQIVVASKRGRSHANVGSFRDDDFAFRHLHAGWNIVCVADGAGSAKLSREGSRIACSEIIDFFEQYFSNDAEHEIDRIMNNYHTVSSGKTESVHSEDKSVIHEHQDENEQKQEIPPTGPGDGLTGNTLQSSQKEISNFLYTILGAAALRAHKKLEETANKMEVHLKDFHTTLIFALYKKYEFGYAVLTFGVGDCPIGLLNKELTEITLMNWLDVGEFGGGTRFITMPEIFSSDKFSTRFGFKLIEDFSYLMLMTDGIYDPKFVVEANLEKLEKWKDLIEDLKGNNEEKAIVEFNSGNKEITSQLSAWMDFWSPGNHDDRTFAIVF